jgi:hypothetical protein
MNTDTERRELRELMRMVSAFALIRAIRVEVLSPLRVHPCESVVNAFGINEANRTEKTPLTMEGSWVGGAGTGHAGQPGQRHQSPKPTTNVNGTQTKRSQLVTLMKTPSAAAAIKMLLTATLIALANCVLALDQLPGGAAPAAAIPLDQLGAVAGKQYQGDALGIAATPEGARLRCGFQKLEGRATSEGLWLESTEPGGGRLRVMATAVGRTTDYGVRQQSEAATPLWEEARLPMAMDDCESGVALGFTQNLTTLLTTNAPLNGGFGFTDPTPPTGTAFYRLMLP